MLKQAVALLEKGEMLAVPTDSSYALVCHVDDKAAADKLRRIRGVDDKHHLTLLCRDLSELANYARVDNQQFRLHQIGHARALHLHSGSQQRSAAPPEPPGSRKTIGLRVPDHKVLQELLELHHAPLLATTLIPQGETEALNDAQEIRERYKNLIAAVIDAGACALEPTTVVDLSSGEPEIVREGRGIGRGSGPVNPDRLRQFPHGHRQPHSDHCHLRAARAVRHHGARSRARLCRAPLWRQHGLHAGAHHAQPTQAH